MFTGRQYELKRLNQHHESNQAELIIIYGRRRIGKSTLIHEFCRDKQHLHFEALENAKQHEQIDHFLIQLSEQMKMPKFDCKTWRQVFDALTPVLTNGKWVVAFDEFPWMANKKTKLVSLLKYYWDQKWRNNSGLTLILCGSVASFMFEHLIHSKSLHNRKTLEIKLDHLSPSEVLSFFKKQSLKEVTQIMMMVGGVPKYLEMFDQNQSVKINLNRLFFCKDGFFVNEFETIFKEQFKKTKYYEAIIKALSVDDLSLTDIAKKIKLTSSGTLKKYLDNLSHACFIEEMPSISLTGHKTRTKKYRISDPFLNTYFKFIAPNKKRIIKNKGFQLIDGIMGEVWHTFFGIKFDWFVYESIQNILHILEIPESDVLQYGPFFRQSSRGRKKIHGVQIDLILVRKNQCITIIENTLKDSPVGADILETIENKISKINMPSTWTVEKVFIASCGVTPAVQNSSYFNKIITLEDLFNTS